MMCHMVWVAWHGKVILYLSMRRGILIWYDMVALHVMAYTCMVTW
jgi:hypothetical protein